MEAINKTAANGIEKVDNKALFRIGYGLYVLTTRDGEKDNGSIINTVIQVTSTPNRVAVTLNKSSYSHELAQKSGKMNVNCLSKDTPFSVFQRFGFQSGREVNKFEGVEITRTENGLAVLTAYVNAVLSLTVEQYVDLGTHGMFICSLDEARVLSDAESITYDYYQKAVKPRSESAPVKGYVCRVCGWVYEGDPLPEDIVCPICKHGASDFEPIR